MSENTPFILIVDDDDAVRESFQFHFEDCDWQVLPALTAEHALEYLQNETPDCAIIDIRLPGMDGNMLMREIHQSHPGMACVICTGSPEYQPPVDIANMIQVSKRVYIKPVIKMDELESTLRKQIEICRQG